MKGQLPKFRVYPLPQLTIEKISYDMPTGQLDLNNSSLRHFTGGSIMSGTSTKIWFREH